MDPAIREVDFDRYHTAELPRILAEGNGALAHGNVADKGSLAFRLDGTDPDAPQGVALTAEAGDVTLHYGDGMHVSMPTTTDEGPRRVSVPLAFARPDARHHRGEGHCNDVLPREDDGTVEHLADAVAERT